MHVLLYTVQFQRDYAISNYISDFASFISRNGHAYYGHLDLTENHMPFEFIDVYDKERVPHKEHIGHYGWSEFMEPRTDAHHLIWASELNMLDVHTQNLMENNDDEDAPILPLEINVNDNTNPNFLWIQNTNKDIAKNNGFATALMLGIAYSATIGGMTTLIGTAPNAVFASFIEGLSPTLPASCFSEPILINPCKKVPVVKINSLHLISAPLWQIKPKTLFLL